MSDQGEVRRRFRITGHVQGVFFRDTTRDVARRAGAVGWVRNNPDGTVEAEVQGTPEAVEQVAGFVREGPRRARVRDVSSEELPLQEGERDFRVR